ncbi:MAG: hypothetical protein MK102_09715 [Fuerstiella sp.]|nr:hypothetical protein [Fuerstiella sp.]
MNGRLFPWLTFGVLLGSLLGMAFGKGDPRAPLFVGAVGALLGLVGFMAVSATHKAWKIDASKTNNLAILGALLGAICGGVIGALSSFGRLMISIFNPSLPERDFQTLFGAIGGTFLGALFGACFVSAIAPFFRRRKTRHEETAGDNHSEANTT